MVRRVRCDEASPTSASSAAIPACKPLRLARPNIATASTTTEPIIAPIRQVMPRMGMLDLSPIVALVLLRLIGVLVNQALVS